MTSKAISLIYTSNPIIVGSVDEIKVTFTKLVNTVVCPIFYYFMHMGVYKVTTCRGA